MNVDGGNNTVDLGTADDIVNVTNVADTDNIDGGDGDGDVLNIRTSANLSNANLLSGFEQINLNPTNATGDFSITLDDDNAPSVDQVLNVNGGTLGAGNVLTFNGDAITAYNVNVTGGAGNDTLSSMNGVGGDTLNGGAGNDILRASAEAGVADTLNGGAGNDSLAGFGGDLVINGGEGADEIFKFDSGLYNVSAGAGNDILYVENATWTAADIVDGGDGTDQIWFGFGSGPVTDAQFANKTSVEILGKAFSSDSITIGANAQAAGIRTVALSSTGDDTLDASAYTVGLTVNTEASLTLNNPPYGPATYETGAGNDTVITGSGADLVLMNDGISDITLNAGNDVVRAENGELTFDDVIDGGAGDDTIELDNSMGGVEAYVDLDNVSSIENYELTSSGDLGAGVDANDNLLVFTGDSDSVTDVTVINVDASMLTDTDDSLTVRLDSNLQEGDYSFVITGGAATTIVDKDNLGVDNNIDFNGGSGEDILQIDGDDLGSTVEFDGNGGRDVIYQTGGTITDDGFISVTGVEVISGDAGMIDVVLGQRAEVAGINEVEGTDGDDMVVLGAGYDGTLTLSLMGGTDTVNGGAGDAVLVFEYDDLNDLGGEDTLTGGTTANDRINATFSAGASSLDGVAGVETLNIATAGSNGTTIPGGQLYVDLGGISAADAPGGFTLNAAGLNGFEDLFIDGVGATTMLTLNLGGGDDLVFGGLMADRINAGGGDDEVYGEAGNDVIYGQGGADTIYGGAGRDEIHGGDGDDTIEGGAGGDMLWGNAGADTFVYNDQSESFGGQASTRDTIMDFVSGEDVIDLTNIDFNVASGDATDPVATGNLEYLGEVNTFADVEGSISGGGNVQAIFLVDEDGVGGTLYIDADNDGDISANDIQIRFETVSDLDAADLQYAGGDAIDSDPDSTAVAPANDGIDLMVNPFDMHMLAGELG